MYRTELDKALAPLVERLWQHEPKAGWDYRSVEQGLTFEDVEHVVNNGVSDIVEDYVNELSPTDLLALITGLPAAQAALVRSRIAKAATQSLAELLLPALMDRCEHEESERVRELPKEAQSRIRAWSKP